MPQPAGCRQRIEPQKRRSNENIREKNWHEHAARNIGYFLGGAVVTLWFLVVTVVSFGTAIRQIAPPATPAAAPIAAPAPAAPAAAAPTPAGPFTVPPKLVCVPDEQSGTEACFPADAVPPGVLPEKEAQPRPFAPSDPDHSGIARNGG